jgi:[ribosomal protein S5]-alanine N-acetyltransferase
VNDTRRPDKKNFPSSRFALRPLSLQDEPLYREIYCDSDTMRHVGRPLSPEQAVRSFHSALRQTNRLRSQAFFVAVIDNSTGASIGICGATLGVPRLGSAEVGIMLRSDARGKGNSRYVLGGFIDSIFESFCVEQVWVRYEVKQEAVVRLNEGLGFVVCDEPPSMFAGSQTAYIRRDTWLGVCQINQQGVTPCPM